MLTRMRSLPFVALDSVFKVGWPINKPKPTMAECVVLDIQCVRFNNNDFIVKELAAVSVKPFGVACVLTFQPPCTLCKLSLDVQRQIQWLERHHHMIPFESGLYPYETLKLHLTTLAHPFSTILCKGLEKARFLNNILQQKVINLEDYGCPSLDSFHHDHYCDFHLKKGGTCALRNAKALVQWFGENSRLRESVIE